VRDRTTQILDDGNAIFEFEPRKTKKRATQGLDRRQPVKGSPSQKHLESWNFGISKERIIIYILLLLLQISILTPKVLHTHLKPNPNQIPTFPPFWNQFQPFYLTLQYTHFHPTYPHPQTKLSTEIPPPAYPAALPLQPQEDNVTILYQSYCIICKVML